MAGREPGAGVPDWLALNRANWDERVAIHRAVAARGGGGAYDRAGLGAIEAAELGVVAGLKVLHLQCHFGRDTLALARLGAVVTGVDFSGPAIAAAQEDAAAAGLAARFVEADVYAATAAVGEPGTFDLVYTTWGTTGWLPDLDGWAGVIAAALKPGGRLYYADLHPVASVLDPGVLLAAERPAWELPYFEPGPHPFDDPSDYADPAARLVNSRTIQFLHPLGRLLGALQGAGLRLVWLREHPRMAWQQFPFLVRDAEGLWTWPGRAWLPLAVSLVVEKG